MNIYVGNLPYSATEASIRELFTAHGQVDSAKVISDRDTGRSKGFGFVEMVDSDEAKAAIQALDGMEVEGRRLKVNEAKPRNDNRR